MFKEIIDFIRNLYNQPTGIIPLHAPYFGGNEKKYVLEAINSTFVSSVGNYVNKFEEMMCKITGAKYAVAAVNGTSALHIALLLGGVKKDEEVITQSLSFIATANAISYCGARPIFLDVDENTLGMSTQKLAQFLNENAFINDQGQCINRSTKKRIAAVVPMHTFGLSCQIDKIVQICQDYSLPVIEDAAESLGSVYRGKHTGTFGRLGIYSLNGNKIVTSGGGGCIITNEETYAVKAKHLTTTAKKPHQWEYNHDEIGYNYRLTNLSAALGCAQLEQLGSFITKKKEISRRYEDFFKDISGVEFITPPEENESNYWLNAIKLTSKKERDIFLTETNNSGIQTRPIWSLLHTMPMYSDCQTDDLYHSIQLEKRVVNLPSSIIHDS